MTNSKWDRGSKLGAIAIWGIIALLIYFHVILAGFKNQIAVLDKRLQRLERAPLSFEGLPWSKPKTPEEQPKK